ncbi:protein GUCD1 isoform X2 [Sitophilus oryzae]|uniref:Protein GUCD1 isoform X2 n=1 Tax=Sitophilus oryzae TaxID=7048 RepID=A0A6J2XE41_SITOR|nr:protein GUCD1 isoform X2 [Sitophilus oryzae]
MKRNIRLNKDLPNKHLIQLCHYKQKSNWDCGISCIAMVLSNKYRDHFIKNISKICKIEGFNKSTWSIDLCYLLKRYNIEHRYCTITIGVHEGYRGNSFYHNILSKDEYRVNKRFKEASKNNIYIENKSVTLREILEHLINGPVIVLTNARLLCCDICKFNKVTSELRKCLPWPITYQGHYIVLCGYDIYSQKVYYRNPTFNDHVCIMPVLHFDQARKSYGTDEDIIFVYK